MKLRIFLNLIIATLLVIVTGEYDEQRASIVETLERQSYDWRLSRSISVAKKRDDIVIVNVDQYSLQEFGRWPWSRDRFARLNDQLFKKYKVRIVAFALPFSQPDDKAIQVLEEIDGRLGSDEINSTFKLTYVDRLAELRSTFNYDRQFSDSLIDRAVVLSHLFSASGRIQGGLPQPVNFVNGSDSSNKAVVPAPILGSLSQKWPFMRAFSGNVPLFLQSNKNMAGHVNAIVDSDGVIRRVPFFVRHAGAYYASLPATVLRRMQGGFDSPVVNAGISSPFLSFLGGNHVMENIVIGHYSADLNTDSSSHIRFLGIGGESVDFDTKQNAVFRYLSIADVIEGRVAEELLNDKIVLIGSSSPVLRDLHTTPVNAAMPGVELMATQIANLLDGQVLHRKNSTLISEVFILLLLLFALSVVFAYLGPLLSIIILLGVCLSHVIFVLYQWDANQVWAMTPLLLSCSGLYMFSTISGFVFEWRSSRLLQSTFSQYVPSEIAKQIGQDGSKVNLEGELRDLSVLFTDVRNFTTISERMSPRELTLLMNRILTVLTEVVHKHGGTVDKYIGDAMMTFWNAPLFDAQHARNATLAAIDMQRAIQALSDQWVADGGQAIRLGVGICTGEANVGNMGSTLRMAYTAIGDTVNLASRTESLTKKYSQPILVTETTVVACQQSGHDDEIYFRAVDIVRVKGRHQPVTLYYPVGFTRLIPAEMINRCEQFEGMRQAYIRGDFEQAEQLLQQCRQHFPDDEMTILYDNRLRRLKNSVIPSPWEGIMSRTEVENEDGLGPPDDSNQATEEEDEGSMKVTILGNMGGCCRGCLSISALVDDCILLDIGTGAQTLSFAQLEKISDVVLTHSHLDHTAMLCFLVDCRLRVGGVTVHCLPETADALRHGFFNNTIWPDMEKLLTTNGEAAVRFNIIKPYQSLDIQGRRFTPLPVEHAVPTVAYCLHGERENFVFVADLFDADPAFWDYLNQLDNFKRMTMEVSFPDGEETIAEISKHLTPSMLAKHLTKIPESVQIYYFHVKPEFQTIVVEQMNSRFGDRIKPLRLRQVLSL